MHEPAFFAQYFDFLDLKANTRRFIIDSYTAEDRHYHGLGHLALMIQDLTRRWEPSSSYVSTYTETELRRLWPSLLLAVFFHDIVYDARAPKNENEELSAVAMKFHAPEGADVALVEKMILATRSHHFPEERSWDADAITAFLSADLSILWSKPETYAWYARGVRKEYGWVENQVYRTARAGVLDVLVTEVGPKQDLLLRYKLDQNVKWEKQQLESGALDV